MGIRIRLYDHRRDADDFQALNSRTFRDSVPDDEPLGNAAFRKHYAWLLEHFAPDDPRRSTVFVAEVQGRYAGHCWLGVQNDFFTHRPDPWIFDLSVVPEFRRRGVAAALHGHVLAWLKQSGAERVGLQVMAHNAEAMALYRKLGYRPRAHLLKLEL